MQGVRRVHACTAACWLRAMDGWMGKQTVTFKKKFHRFVATPQTPRNLRDIAARSGRRPDEVRVPDERLHEQIQASLAKEGQLKHGKRHRYSNYVRNTGGKHPRDRWGNYKNSDY